MEQHTTSRMQKFLNMNTNVTKAIAYKPDDRAEWANIFQEIYLLRQALACIICGRFVPDPYTPIQEPCHCVCVNCKDGNRSTQTRQNCPTCRNALETEDGFGTNHDLNYTAAAFQKTCKYLVGKEMAKKWSELPLSTQNGNITITFGQLIQEISDSGSSENDFNLGDKFRKRVKEKEHHCRCGSGAKKQSGRSPGNLTCLGQRCACYKDSKGCDKCKCVGCKNPYGMSSNT